MKEQNLNVTANIQPTMLRLASNVSRRFCIALALAGWVAIELSGPPTIN
jgi:hypothetical protein